MKERSPYECSFWKDEREGYNWEVNVIQNERMQFVRMMIEREEEKGERGMRVWIVYGRDEKWNEEAVWGVYADVGNAMKKMVEMQKKGHGAKVEEWEVKGE